MIIKMRESARLSLWPAIDRRCSARVLMGISMRIPRMERDIYIQAIGFFVREDHFVSRASMNRAGFSFFVRYTRRSRDE